MSESEQRIIFSNNLKKYVSQSGKSQKDIADDINVSPQTFNTWMKGIAIPRMGKIQKLADYFHINKSQLMEKEKEIFFIDEKTRQIAQEIADNKELGLLFDAARTAAPEDLKTTHDMLLALKRKERGDYPES